MSERLGTPPRRKCPLRTSPDPAMPEVKDQRYSQTNGRHSVCQTNRRPPKLEAAAPQASATAKCYIGQAPDPVQGKSCKKRARSQDRERPPWPAVSRVSRSRRIGAILRRHQRSLRMGTDRVPPQINPRDRNSASNSAGMSARPPTAASSPRSGGASAGTR